MTFFPQTTPLDQLPANLPVPKDDGACRHLSACALPDLELAVHARIAGNLAKVTRDAASSSTAIR